MIKRIANFKITFPRVAREKRCHLFLTDKTAVDWLQVNVLMKSVIYSKKLMTFTSIHGKSFKS